MHYKWPGNVRQLKNITEQISILSTERLITPEQLRKFIPQDQESTQLTMVSKKNDHNFENEREILYKILYELRGNVNDLRRDISMLKKRFAEEETHGAQNFLQTTTAPIAPIAEDAIAEEYVEYHSANNKEQESLNLNTLERQTLEKALERNGGNRKKAAQELGISDRTLYRRLKQYGLEEK